MPDHIIDAYDRDGSEQQQVRAVTSDYKGQKYFSFRAWYFESDEYKPARNGLNLPVKEYHEFRQLVAEMDRELGYVPATEEVLDGKDQ